MAEAHVKSQQAKSKAESEEIQKLAYEIYLKRGSENGRDVEDWLEAEEVLKAKSKSK